MIDEETNQMHLTALSVIYSVYVFLRIDELVFAPILVHCIQLVPLMTEVFIIYSWHEY